MLLTNFINLWQHHLYSIWQAGRHPEDLWGVDPGSESHAGRPLPVVHGWPAPTLHLRGGQSEVGYNAVSHIRTAFVLNSFFLVDLMLLVQDQESGSWGQYDWRFDGSECSAWRAGTDVHHPEGAPSHHDTNTLLDVLEAILTECCSLYAYGHYSLLTRWSVKLFCCRPATSRSKTSLQHSGRHNVATRSTIPTGKSCKSKSVTFNWKPLGRTELRETLLHNFYQEPNVERRHWSFTNLLNTTKDSDYREMSPSGGRSSNCTSRLYRYSSRSSPL